MKTFGLHFQYRDDRGELQDVGLVCQSRSKVDAKITGKNLAAQHSRAERGPGGVWFCGLISEQSAKATGGALP